MGKKELIKATKPRYLKADKKGRSRILDEFCSNTDLNRKYAITIFSAGYEYDKVTRYSRKKRKVVYGSDVTLPVIKIWELLEHPCGARLQPALLPTARAMIRHSELTIGSKVKQQLGEYQR